MTAGRITSVFFSLLMFTLAGAGTDSLYRVLPDARQKSVIHNLLAEALLHDSMEASLLHAETALKYAIQENNLQQQGVAQFNMAEVYALSYRADSAIVRYNRALEIF